MSRIQAWPWDFGTARAREQNVERGLANLMSPLAQNKQAVSSVLPATPPPPMSPDGVGSGDLHPASCKMTAVPGVTLLLIGGVV